MTFMSFAGMVNGQSNHIVTITGNSTDFYAAEKLSAASGQTDYYVTFDVNNLYIGAFRNGTTSNSGDFLNIFIDTDPTATVGTSGSGATTGNAFNGVTGSLPFTANYSSHLLYNTSTGNYYELRPSSGTGWSGSATSSGMSQWESSTAFEIAIPWSSIGNPDAINLALFMGYTNGTYANAPGANVAGSASPSIVNYFGTFCVKNGSVGNVLPVSVISTPVAGSTTFSAAAIPAGTYGDIYMTGACTLGANISLAPGAVINIGNGTTTSSLAMTGSSNTITRTSINADTLSNEILIYDKGTFTFTPSTAVAKQVYVGTINVQNGGTLNATTTTTGLASMPLMCNNFIVASGGNYTHGMYGTSSSTNGLTQDFPGGTPGSTITLGAASQVTITKWALTTATAPAPLPTTSWGTLTINVSTFGGNWNQNGALNTIQDSLIVTNVGGGYLLGFASANNETVNIGGALIINGANAQFGLNLGTATCYANVAGNCTITNGITTLNFGSGGRGILNVAGNFSMTGGTVYQTYSTGQSDFNITGTATLSGGAYIESKSTGPAGMTVTGLTTLSGVAIQGQNGTNCQDTFNLNGGVTMSTGSFKVNDAAASTYNTVWNMNGTGAAFSLTGGTIYSEYGQGSTAIYMTSPTSSFSMTGGVFYMNYNYDPSRVLHNGFWQ